MLGSAQADAYAPQPPPKPQRSRTKGFFNKDSRFERKQQKRQTRYVDPQLIQDPDTSSSNHLDIIDQLDISGLTGNSCMFHACFFTNFSVSSRFAVRLSLIHI